MGVGVSAWGDGSVGLERALVAAPQRAWGHTPESGLNGRCYGVSCTTTNKTYPDSSTRSNQSILKEISPGISLEGMMLKLKLQYFGHLM